MNLKRLLHKARQDDRRLGQKIVRFLSHHAHATFADIMTLVTIGCLLVQPYHLNL